MTAAGDRTDARTLVLVDVDGVLNVLGIPERGRDWRSGEAVAAGRSWPIRWSPDVVDRIAGWSLVADVQWLTTWGHDANTSLRHLLGLPELSVAATHDAPLDPDAARADDEGDPGPPGPSHAAMTPAAPDALTGRWWKFDAVRRIVHADPDRRLVWLDDDLYGQEEVRAWMRAHATALLIAPDPRTGLVQEQLNAVERWL